MVNINQKALFYQVKFPQVVRMEDLKHKFLWIEIYSLQENFQMCS